MGIALDFFQTPKAINFPRKNSDVVALVSIIGPGGAGVSGDHADNSPIAGPVKISSGIRFESGDTSIQLFFQTGSAEGGGPPSVSYGDLSTFHVIVFDPITKASRYVFGDELYANALAANRANGLPDPTGPFFVTITNLDGLTHGGRWGIDFVADGIVTPPGLVDITQSSFVVKVAPAPPAVKRPDDPPDAIPNEVIFTIQSTVSIPAEIANNNTVNVIGYGPAEPTPDNPTPSGISYKDNGDGTITVSGGQKLWEFTVSNPDLIAYSPLDVHHPDTVIAVKFNSKGLV